MDQEQATRLIGFYTQPYNEIVRPERVWKISKYLLRRWTPYLSPNEVWLIIGARQLSYFNEKRPWFRAYDATLAEAAGLHVKVFRRTIKKAIVAGEGHIARFLSKEADPTYRRKGGVTRQTQTQYAIRRDDPLTPGDAQALAHWLRRHSPRQITPENVRALLEEALAAENNELRAESPAPVEAAGEGQNAVCDVVAQVFPAVAGERAWREAADALHTHVVRPELAHFETHYWRRRWLPELGAGPALLLTYLRSLCYHNESSGEIRDEVQLRSGELEAVFQVSSRTLRRWFGKLEEAVDEENLLGQLYRVVQTVKQPDQKVATTYWINLKTPLTPQDLDAYRQRLLANGLQPEEGEADRKFPTGQEGAGQRVPYTGTGNGQKVVHMSKGQGQKVAHDVGADGQSVPHKMGGGGQEVAGSGTNEGDYKYYKILSEGIGLESLEDLWAKGLQEEQQAWHVDDGWAGRSFAAVAAIAPHDGLAALLDRLGVQEPARGQIVRQRPSCEEVVAWHLYTEQEAGLEQPLSYLIRRLLEGDAPPLPFLQAASLSWEQWRAYAAVCYLWDWVDTEVASSVEQWPLFAQWRELFGDVTPAELPFDVGRGLAALRERLAANVAPASASEVAVKDEAALCWQAALCELELQMTRATFEAWLQDAVLLEREEDTFVVGVRNEAAREWLANRMQRVVERTLTAVAGEGVRVRFVVGE